MTTALLPLAGSDAYLLLDALVAFANAEEKENPADAEAADLLAARIRALRGLLSVDGDQLLRAMGLGRYERRPQG